MLQALALVKFFIILELFLNSLGTVFFSTWMLYLFLVPIHSLTKIDPFLLLKLSAPVIYAFNVCAVYFFSRKWLNWSIKKSFFSFNYLFTSIGYIKNFMGLVPTFTCNNFPSTNFTFNLQSKHKKDSSPIFWSFYLCSF